MRNRSLQLRFDIYEDIMKKTSVYHINKKMKKVLTSYANCYSMIQSEAEKNMREKRELSRILHAG